MTTKTRSQNYIDNRANDNNNKNIGEMTIKARS